MSQTLYVTESASDPELKYLEYDHIVWKNAPYRGILMPVDKFKKSVGLMSAAHELEFKGIDALPDQLTPTHTDELLWGGGVGVAVTLTLCFLLKCQF